LVPFSLYTKAVARMVNTEVSETHQICVNFIVLYIFKSSKNVQNKIYRNIILPAVFCVCETLSLTLREEYQFRMSKNRVLRRIFGPNG